ncbi:MAG: Caldesmon [uncultured Sulfurovum sp.]|uniref:Caldesmon n=1 Tax=uncultured Sulfurovum sp. TaxID=269237 RepID=A0A6S6UDJ6_9BACT|nr:MAG: Caldesmon [uncultured Sulfurovum sp.]
MSTPTTIKCPNCATEIDIDELFYHQIEEKFKQQHMAEQKKLLHERDEARQEYKTHLDALKAKEEAFKDEKEKFDEDLRKATKEQLKLERAKLADELKRKLVEEQSESMALLQKELKEKSQQVQELNASKALIEKLKREKEEVASAAKVEAQRALSDELRVEKEKLSRQAQEEKELLTKQVLEANELKIKAKDEQIEQMKRSLDDAKRKSEQGSMQLQGEALELAIEEWLSSQFPFDTVDEVKKGAFGADCVQTIHTRELQNCGVICYESKNTKAWSDGWVTKLKQDMLKVNADIGVLVTSVYPSGMERMGFVDGIWVCDLTEFRGSVSLLRESLIRVHKTVQREENRGDKMTLLYNYLTGNEFSMQMNSIVEGFMTMQTELDKERRSLMASWKRRQKLIDGVLQNTTEMYGSLQGIAGAGALGHIEALELPEDFEEGA